MLRGCDSLHAEHSAELSLTPSAGQGNPGLASDTTLEYVNAQGSTQRERKSARQFHAANIGHPRLAFDTPFSHLAFPCHTPAVT